MRVLSSVGLLLAVLAARTTTAAPSIPRKEYQERRETLRRNLKGLFVAFARPSSAEEQLRTGFFQEPYFYYLTGWTEPDAVVLLTKGEEELFLPPRNEHYERYYGHKTSPTDADAVQVTGFKKILPLTDLETEIYRLLGEARTVNILEPEPQSALVKQLFAFRPQITFEDITKQLNAQRQVKSESELNLLQYSADVSIEAHTAALHQLDGGVYEFQIAALMEKTWSDRGCERPAYSSIIGSGPNGVVLHYSADKRKMESGDLVVIDAAAECSYYASDITRTLPVNGRFTARQKEIYDIVLSAQQKAIDAVKPGMVIGKKDTKGSLMQIAYEEIDTHGKDLHGDSLGKYFLHGLSHHVGLDVHDPGDIMAPLKPGMVITIEPGVYIREENLGIRIEDMVLVTESGHRVLTEALPKSAEAIESPMKQRRR